MSITSARIPNIICSYLSDEPSPQKVALEVREHFQNVYESHRARAQGEPEMAYIYFRKELVNGANVYRMTDEILINHVSVYFTLRDLNAARITCSRWYGLLTKNIVWRCQIPRYIPLVVMPPSAYLLNKTLGAFLQVKLIFLDKRIACLQEAGVTIGGVNTYRDLAREVDTKKDQLAKHLYIFAREGQIDFVRIILQSSTVSQGNRGLAVANAALNGHLSIVQELLKDGAVISQENRGWAMINATSNGHLLIVQELLKDGVIISRDDRECAVRNAAFNGHLLVVQELLKDGAVITQEYRGWAVRRAAMNGHLSIVQELLKDGAVISQRNRGLAVNNAAMNGHLLIVQELLKDGAVISQKDRGIAVCSAAQSGHLSIVQELLIGGEISSEHREQAIQATTNQDIINLLTQV